MRHALALLALLALTLAAASAARAQGERRAGIVVQYGDGSVQTACVSFSEESLTGVQLLERSGIPTVMQSGGIGAAVCKIGPDGCNYPAESCFCKRDGARSIYWAFYTRAADAWAYASLGAANTRARDGDVHGWAWGAGDSSGGALPPALSIDTVCGAAAAPAPAPATQAPSPEPPTAEPPTAEPLTAEPPTQAPPTRPPATAAPAASEAPARASAAVVPPTAQAATQAPTGSVATSALTTAAPAGSAATSALATEAPPIEPPATETRATSVPATEAPTTAAQPTASAAGGQLEAPAETAQGNGISGLIGFGAIALILAAGVAIAARRK